MERTTNLVAEPGERVEVQRGLDWATCVVEAVETRWLPTGPLNLYYVWVETELLRLRVCDLELRKPQDDGKGE